MPLSRAHPPKIVAPKNSIFRSATLASRHIAPMSATAATTQNEMKSGLMVAEWFSTERFMVFQRFMFVRHPLRIWAACWLHVTFEGSRCVSIWETREIEKARRPARANELLDDLCDR